MARGCCQIVHVTCHVHVQYTREYQITCNVRVTRHSDVLFTHVGAGGGLGHAGGLAQWGNVDLLHGGFDRLLVDTTQAQFRASMPPSLDEALN